MNLRNIILGIVLLISIIYPAHTFSQTIPAKEFKNKLEIEKGILIDVRTPEEFNDERIEKAINMNVKDSVLFEQQVKDLDKTKAYFLYCGVGKRGNKALMIMKQNGFTRVYNLEGGLAEWKKKSYKVNTDKLY